MLGDLSLALFPVACLVRLPYIEQIYAHEVGTRVLSILAPYVHCMVSSACVCLSL